jgi:DNA-binding NarL/FixJ family response regulator
LSPTRHYRECLARALFSSKAVTVVDLGRYDPADLDRLRDLKPEAMLLDLSGTRAAQLVRRMGAILPGTALVGFSSGDDESEILEFFEAGLTGYVPGNASLGDVEDILRRALRHELHCPPGITEAMVRRLRALGAQHKTALRSDHLSPRERAVLGLIEQGLTNKEIAFRLGIEPATVKNHVHRILKKLAVHRRGEAASRLRHPGLRALQGERSSE